MKDMVGTGQRGKTKVINLRNFALYCVALLVLGCNESALRPSGYSHGEDVRHLRPTALRIIREGLADEDPHIRSGALEVAATTKQTELMPEVRRLLMDDFVPVRFSAALAAGDMKYQLAAGDLIKLLKDADENVRIAAAYALEKLGHGDSFTLLSKALAGKDQTLRANAVVLLGKSRDKRALELLYWAKSDEDSDAKVRFQAAEAIARLGDERIYTKLWTMLISKYIENKIIGIKAMGALGTAQARDALITMLGDEVPAVRLAAAEQLGMLGYKTGEPEVLDVFSKNLTAGMNRHEAEQVKVLAALAIGRIGTESLRKFLPKLLKDRSKYVRLAAARAVFECTMQ